MQFMLLLENAAALVNLHKLYNSLSLFIKSLSNILAYGWEGGGHPRLQFIQFWPRQPKFYLFAERVSVYRPLWGAALS